MFKKIVLILNFLFSSFLFATNSRVEDLHIYGVFQNAKLILMEDILLKKNENVDFEKKYLKII